MRKVLDSQVIDGKVVTTRYFPVPLVGWYWGRATHHLQQARRAATAVGSTDPGAALAHFEASFLTVLYSAFTLEACANDTAERELESAQLKDFSHGRKAFAPPTGVSRCIWKWRLLLERKGRTLAITAEPLASAEALVQARHEFEHYRPVEFATQAIFEKPLPVFQLGVEYSVEIWRAFEPPARIEPSAVEAELCAASAERHHGAARALLACWLEAIGEDPAQLDPPQPAP
jgi:hypothetical protein